MTEQFTVTKREHDPCECQPEANDEMDYATRWVILGVVVVLGTFCVFGNFILMIAFS